MRLTISIVFMACMFACHNKNQNAVLNQNWERSTFEKNIKELYKSNDISCSQLLNYITYPKAEKEFEKSLLKDVLLKIDLKSENISIDSTFDYNHELGKLVDFRLNEKTNNLELFTSITNNNNFDEKIEEIQVDLWYSKFWYNGTYTYTNFEVPIVSSNSEIINRLYLPFDKIEETFNQLGVSDIQLPYQCLTFKLKKIKKSKITK